MRRERPDTLTINIAVVTLAFALSWALDTIWLSDVRTESLIIHTALSLSHRDVPYHRHHLPQSKSAGKVQDSYPATIRGLTSIRRGNILRFMAQQE